MGDWEQASAHRQDGAGVQEMGSLLALAAHDLLTSLSIIRGFAQLVRDKRSLPAGQVTEFSDAIVRQTDRLVRLIRQLEHVGRLEGGEMTLASAPVDAAALIAGCVGEVAAEWPQRRIVTSSPPGLPSIRGDEDYLRDAVGNLISHACAFAPDGTDVTVSARASGSEVRVGVTDLGDPPADLSVLFSRVVRVSRRGGGDGAQATGLGLYVARRVVEAHGGRVWAAGANPGLTLWAALPAAG